MGARPHTVFHVKHPPTAREIIDRTAIWATGVPVDDAAFDLLSVYASWLIDEAMPAGGIGPEEGERVWARHVADSLTFAGAVSARGTTADLGTGVGLPAIPLAIVHPASRIAAIDRSQRRIDLTTRAVRLLQLENVEPQLVDIEDLTTAFDGLTIRAVSGVDPTLRTVTRLLRPGGVAVMGLSTRISQLEPLVHDKLDLERVTVPAGLFDGPSTLLRMVRRVDRTG